MSDINSCTFTGRLTRDSELKYSQNGMAIVKFGIAVSRRQQVNGEWRDMASFFNLVWMGKGAEACHQYLVKGRAVAVQCECRQEKYSDQYGNEKQSISFIVNNLQLLSSGQQKQADAPAEDMDNIPF